MGKHNTTQPPVCDRRTRHDWVADGPGRYGWSNATEYGPVVDGTAAIRCATCTETKVIPAAHLSRYVS